VRPDPTDTYERFVETFEDWPPIDLEGDGDDEQPEVERA